jgi:hypothetical protein
MDSLGLNYQQTVDSVEEFQFDPIKGYPRLSWQGKLPFKSTHYYPAQLKESYGNDSDGWYNKLFWGDNLQVMSHLLKQFRGQVDLIYIDPPFDSKADYRTEINLPGTDLSQKPTVMEQFAYADTWEDGTVSYLKMLYPRLLLMKEMLADTGSIFVHIDWHVNSYVKVILDDILGKENFRNEIIWYYPNSGLKARSKKFEGSPIFRSNAFILTGSFKRGSYKEIASILESYEATVLTDIAGKRRPDAVIVGGTNEDISGLIIKSAKAADIPIIEEDDFFRMYGIDQDLAANLL